MARVREREIFLKDHFFFNFLNFTIYVVTLLHNLLGESLK